MLKLVVRTAPDKCQQKRQIRVDWGHVRQSLEAHMRSDPRCWVLILENAPTSRAARDMKEHTEFVWTNLETYSRKSPPRKDGQKSGFEIWARIIPTQKQIEQWKAEDAQADRRLNDPKLTTQQKARIRERMEKA